MLVFSLSGLADCLIPQWGVVALTAAFAAVAVGFGYYAWRRYRTDLKAAELTEDERRELEAES